MDEGDTALSTLPRILPSLDSLQTLVSINTVLNQDKMPNSSKRVYYCQRCLNHGRLEPRKNHKCECQFAHCTCSKCILVEKRRVLNTQLHELEEADAAAAAASSASPETVKDELSIEVPMTAAPSEDGGADDEEDSGRERNGGMRIKGERVPNCQKCGQHGRKSRLKGHKRLCPYRDCNCAKCQVVSERQKLMADQIKIRRRQRKDTLMNLTRENLTATLNAAAAFQAAGQAGLNFPLGGINAALLYQLKTAANAALGAASGQPPPRSMSPASARSTDTSPTTPAAPQPLYPAEMFLKQQAAAATAAAAGNLPNSAPQVSSPSVTQQPTTLDSVLAASLAAAAAAAASVAATPATGSPPTSATGGLVAPVPINPITTMPHLAGFPTAFPFPLLGPNEALLQMLANYRMLEPKLISEEATQISSSPATPTSNAIIDVCSV